MLLLMIVVMMLSQGMHTLLKDWVFPTKYFSTWLYRYCSILGIYYFYLSNHYVLYMSVPLGFPYLVTRVSADV